MAQQPRPARTYSATLRRPVQAPLHSDILAKPAEPSPVARRRLLTTGTDASKSIARVIELNLTNEILDSEVRYPRAKRFSYSIVLYSREFRVKRGAAQALTSRFAN